MCQGSGAALILASLLGVSAASAAAAAEGGTTSQVLGFQDTKTGTFHALAAVVPDAVSPTTGTVHVTFNIKLVTSFAKGTLIQCSASVDGSSVNTTTGTDTVYEETATDAVAISGTTATCTAVIPYSWLVAASSSTVVDSFSGTYSVTAVATPVAAGAVTRSSYSSLFSTTKIPASGTTSSYTVNVTL